MLGNASSSAIAEHEAYSPSRRKITNTSFSTTPNFPTSPKQRQSIAPITVIDHIVNWFHKEINYRKRIAVGVTSAICSFLFIVACTILRFSLWSFKDTFTWFFHPNEWIPVFVVGIVASVVSVFTILTICKVDQLQRLPYTESSSWALVALDLVQKLIFSNFAIYMSGFSETTEGFTHYAISFGLFALAIVSVFKNDFHYTFPTVQVNSFNSLFQFIDRVQFPYITENCAIETVLAFFTIPASIIIFGPMFNGFQTWWILFNVPFFIKIFALLFIQHFYSKIYMHLVNQIVMRPISFIFPPSYAVYSPTPEQTRTLTNVLETSDPMLKMFALFDLRQVAWNDEIRRRDVFSLSQPGGHPRNWKCVSSVCVRHLDELCSKMKTSAARLVGYSWADHEDNEDDDIPTRDALLMPRRMREMTNRVKSRRPQYTQQQSSLIQKILGKFSMITPKNVVSRYDAQINSYAAEALYMLIIDSLGEDKYGVVQKDLNDLIGLLCKLISSIDAYERARASIADKSDITYLRIVDSSLQSSLQRVVASFGNHLRSLNLPVENLQTIRLVCQIDDF
ncbi:unnamed protein product [Caenorhabditis angaria]|uniref:Nucleoporin NDC1 n=1 Tax=Caenorhabditis angaria TaxID=860376 RepID=A0A9P1IU09_9PELO|nr:unnamed protein product [Caenorhabditis angaria]